MRNLLNEAMPLSTCQQGYLRDTGGDPSDPVHNTALPLLFAQPIDSELLRSALAQVMDRHPMMRAAIDISTDGASQRILSEPADWWREIDASSLDRDAALAGAATDLRRPFTLDQGLFRATLYRDSNAGSLLLLAMHHLATDAASWGIIGRDLLTCCATLSDGIEGGLSPRQTDYRDYIRRERELLAGEQGKRMEVYWTQALADMGPVLNLPTDVPRSPVKSFNGRSQSITLSPELIQGVQHIGAAQNSSRFAVLLTAYLLLLHQRSGQHDIWVMVPSSMSRQQPHYAAIVGLLVSPLVVRLRLADRKELSFSRLVRDVNSQLLLGLYHQPYPVTQLLGRMATAGASGASTPVRAMSAWERSDFIPRTFAAGDLHAERCDIAQLDGLFDLGITFLEDRDGQSIFGALSHNCDLFTPPTVDRMAALFFRILEQAILDAEQPVNRLLAAANSAGVY